MNTARILSSAFALVLIAAAAWAGPATGEAPKSAPMTHVTAKAPAHAKAAARATTPRVDLNSATREELLKLPGVDEATADKIIAARPFKARAELRSKNVVSGVEYARLRDHVLAKPTTVAEAAK